MVLGWPWGGLGLVLGWSLGWSWGGLGYLFPSIFCPWDAMACPISMPLYSDFIEIGDDEADAKGASASSACPLFLLSSPSLGVVLGGPWDGLGMVLGWSWGGLGVVLGWS